MEAGKNVGAVIQAAAILRVVANARSPLGVNAIARAAAVNPSTTLNILRTLVKERLVSLESSTKTYRLDLGIVELARSMLSKTPAELLKPRLQRLANRFEATVSVWHPTGASRLLLLERLKPEIGVHIEFEAAMRIPLYAGAVGRAVAAARAVPIEELRQAFARIRWNSPISFEQYCLEVEAARAQGYAFDFGALIRSVVSTAATVQDPHGEPTLVMSVHTFNGQLSEDTLHVLGRELRSACIDAAAALYGSTTPYTPAPPSH